MRFTFAQLGEQLAATTKKLEKAALLKEYLAALTDADLALATRFLAGRPFALADERVLNVGWAVVRDAICAISGSTPDTFGALATRMGEAGAAADQLEERGRRASACASWWTRVACKWHRLQEVYRYNETSYTATLAVSTAYDEGARTMEYRQLGGSGLKVPVLAFGTATFGGGNEFFRTWGSTQVEEATRLVDIALEAGVNLFDTADAYSGGLAEEILGQAIKGRRDQILTLDQGHLSQRTRPQRAWLLAPSPDRAPARPACAAWAPTTSTFITCTASMRSRRLKKPCARSTTWCAAARCATSAAPTFPAGI